MVHNEFVWRNYSIMSAPSIKISQMPVASTLNGVDYLQIVQNGANLKSTITNFLGNLNSAGNIRINPLQFSIDMTVATVNDANTFFADGSTDRVGIGTAYPLSKLHVNGNTQVGSTSTDGIIVQSSESIDYTAVNQTNSATISISPSRAQTSIVCDSGVSGKFSLPAGSSGQTKTIIAASISGGHTATITLSPAGLGFNTITMSATGCAITLQYNSVISQWCVLGTYGTTTISTV